jgi:hypothetical protein
MDWHCLGHATWLVEADGLRLLFDPLLDNLHHGGVFEVFPPRTIDVEALRPDFVFVTHRHPDHFDLGSLRRLAAVDADSVIVTSDELVASCCRRIGFNTVRVVPSETTIDLDGPRLITTPSVGAIDPEWGVIVKTQDGVVYNQVDTSAGTPTDVVAFFRRALAALQDSPATSAERVTLALARWQPLLEVEAITAGAIGFPFRAYADELSRCAAIGARVAVPSAAGTRHAGPYAFMNRLVYPVTQDRFLADARIRIPSTRMEPCITGATYRIRNGDVAAIDRKGASELVSVVDAASSATRFDVDPRAFRPLEIPGIVDPNLDGRSEADVRALLERWVRSTLAPTLRRKTVRYVLEIILPSGAIDTYTILDGAMTRGDNNNDNANANANANADAAHRGWDVRCAVAGSLLADVVIDHRRHWGELLLGGMLRACSRAYEVDARGVRAIPLQPLFVYEALSYEESVIRSLEFSLARQIDGD